MLSPRQLEATPDKAHEFLAAHIERIAAGLITGINLCEKRIARLALDGPQGHGPDDFDYLNKQYRQWLTEYQAAMEQLELIAPRQEPDPETARTFIENLDRMFPPTRPDDA